METEGIRVGGKYYVILNPYYHFVGRVTEVYGQRSARFTDVVFVYSSRRDWTEFFRVGFGEGDVYKHFPDGAQHGWLAEFDWHHDIPAKPTGWPGAAVGRKEKASATR